MKDFAFFFSQLFSTFDWSIIEMGLPFLWTLFNPKWQADIRCEQKINELVLSLLLSDRWLLFMVRSGRPLFYVTLETHAISQKDITFQDIKTRAVVQRSHPDQFTFPVFYPKRTSICCLRKNEPQYGSISWENQIIEKKQAFVKFLGKSLQIIWMKYADSSLVHIKKLFYCIFLNEKNAFDVDGTLKFIDHNSLLLSCLEKSYAWKGNKRQ